MMTTEEFFSRYESEGSDVEFKEASEGIPRDFWETYSSFANTSGGTVILGIKEEQVSGTLEIVGVQNTQHYLKVLWDTLNNPAKVSINIITNNDVSVETVDGKSIIIIRIPAAERRQKPVYLNGNMDFNTYKRNHEGDYKCRVDEIRSMLRDAYDENDNAPIEDMTGFDCFNDDDVKSYLNLLKSRDHLNNWTEGSLEEVMSIIGAVVVKDQVVHPTRAGLLMFGKVSYILQSFPYYRLDYREEYGNSRWDYRIISDDFGTNYNLFSFVKTVLPRLGGKIGSPFRLDGFVRIDYSEKMEVVREGVVNALVHADYQCPTGVTVVYDGNRIRISNPGGLRIPLEKAKIGGISDPRNLTLMKMFMNIGLVEEMGTGVRLIFRSKDDGSILDVTLSEESDPFRTVLDIVLNPAGYEGTDIQSRILRYVSSNPEASISQIAEELGVSTRTVSRNVSELTEKRVLRKEGSNRRYRWILVP